ncbi:hypothetical protein SPRG_02078 [Saprolegnia parasitica CBS 223.65]|uniref:PHD-type domain-containing protein n=1 Tax=Saprolegnia parasitica (strain CBS 223.65) TaxID=695850 RepID=A0A067CRF8_SAPPC|nr:hypothetical protein SPRG_02078 [Saprolegnia parasitica CBS 223.65]KDO33269.1 hypothetical protein SPRG_02078 [Saprolegnia parasitica CBS 223.65]|eukprot:XP_012196025.1 hypothetical protein SPRG_02078 [Saprolegnia parasitica CBS 223.65]
MDSDSSGAESSSSSDTLLVKKQRLQQGGSLVKKVLTMSTSVSLDACEACESAIRGDQSSVACAGPCCRKFHSDCLPSDGGMNKPWTCIDCRSHSHRCFACQPLLGPAPMKLVPATDATPVACRAAGCGKFYHITCVKKLSLTRVLDDNGFICPLHTCAKCEGSHAASTHAIQCMRCPKAYHTSCVPSTGVQRLPGTARVVCLAHLKATTTIGDEPRRPRMSISSVDSANDGVSDGSETEWPKSREDKRTKKTDKKKKKKKKLKKEKKRARSSDEADVPPPPSAQPPPPPIDVPVKPPVKVQLNITIPETPITADESVVLKETKKRPSSTRQSALDESIDEVDEPEEAKWVQCDSCRKWRTVPQHLDLDAMPEKWYCKMNHWAKAYASCDVPEEVIEPKKKKQKLDHVATPPVVHSAATVVTDKDKKPSKKEQRASTSQSTSASSSATTTSVMPSSSKQQTKDVKWVQCDNVNCGKWRVVAQAIDEASLPSKWFCHLNTWAPELAYCHAENPPEVDSVLMNKKTPKPKRATKDSARSPRSTIVLATDVASVEAALPTEEAPAAAVPLPTPVPVASTKTSIGEKKQKVKKAVLEWAQCEKCNKWRKLPHHVKSSTLPDKWYCSMNHWNIALASCNVPEEADNDPFMDHVVDPRQGWYGAVSGRTKRGKLSYRELLYGGNGHFRKTYTEESSTLSFEYEGKTFYRDDQYRKSSMYQPREPPEFPSDAKPAVVSPTAPALTSDEMVACQQEILRVLHDVHASYSTLDIVLALNSDGAATIYSYPMVQSCLQTMLTSGLIESATEDAIVKVTMPLQISTYASAYYVTGENNHDVRSWDERRPHAHVKYRRKLVSRPPLKLAKPWKQKGFAGFSATPSH